MSHRLEEISFPSQGVCLRACYYIPEDDTLTDAAGTPCVVMAHGLGGTRAAGLAPFAQRFADVGLRVLCFDYRHFGASDGQPRQLYSTRRQLDDWGAAIRHARSLDGVDPTRIALWGSSMSGGHVISAAVEDGRVAACASQGAMMDGRAALFSTVRRAGPVYAIKLVGHALRDAFSQIGGGPRQLIPVVSKPGEIASISSAGSKAGYLAITPADWDNRISCAWMLTLPLYRPNLLAARLPCPTLFCICTADTVVPPAAVEDAARRAGSRAEVKRYPIGHFDIYVGDGFERAVTDQCDFFLRVLKPVAH